MLVVGLGGFASETRPNKELDSVAVAAHFSSQQPIGEREGEQPGQLDVCCVWI